MDIDWTANAIKTKMYQPPKSYRVEFLCYDCHWCDTEMDARKIAQNMSPCSVAIIKKIPDSTIPEITEIVAIYYNGIEFKPVEPVKS